MRRPPEEIRGELRALGYLESPLARFVASGRSASPLATSLGVGLRVGALLGVALGLLLFLGYLALDRFLLLRPLDAALLALYLVVVGFGAGVAFGLAAGLLFAGASAIRRRPCERLDLASRKAALAFGALVALYLALAWSRLRARAGDPPFLADLAAGAACLLAGLLAAAAARPASLVLLALAGREVALTPRAQRRGRLAGALLSVVAVGLFVATLRVGRAGAAAGAPPSFETRETAARVLLLACDGEDAALLETLVSEGALPRLRDLRDRSARFDLDASEFGSPPAFWTSVATGLPVERHGVASAGTVRPRGFAGDLLVDRSAVGFYEVLHTVLPTLRLSDAAPATASLLRERTIFDVVGGRGVPVGLVNYWLSHPAPTGPGFALSERAYWKARFNRLGAARGRRNLPVQGEAHPAALFEEFAAFVEVPPDGADAAARAEALDASVEKALLAFGPRYSPRLAAAGFWGLDTLLHASLARGEGPRPDFETARAASGAYAALDGRVGRVVAAPAFADSTVLFVAFPGSARRPAADRRYNGDRAIAWIAGPGVRPGARGGASPFDLAPTILALLGFPASAEMPGRGLGEAFDGGVLAEPPRVPSFGRRPREARAGREAFDDEMVSILRGLGYL